MSFIPRLFSLGLLSGGALLVASALASTPGSIAIQPGTAKTFQLEERGGTLKPAHLHTAAIGTASPGEGALMISLAPAGHAVGMAKLHVFERSQKPVNFQVVAFKGRRAIATENVCGRLDMDAWVALPAETSRVFVSKFASAKKECL